MPAPTRRFSRVFIASMTATLRLARLRRSPTVAVPPAHRGIPVAREEEWTSAICLHSV